MWEMIDDLWLVISGKPLICGAEGDAARAGVGDERI
jgi:hypothetical protein